MTRTLWLSLSLLLASCGNPAPDKGSSESKDMASDYWSSGSGIWLFYVDRGTLYRADCDENRLIYNRSTCPTVVGSADFAQFSERLRAKFAAQMPNLEQQVADIHGRIQEIDLELLMLLSHVPDPVDPTLKDQIAAKEGETNEAAAALLPWEDQIARIEDSLRTRENPDLRRQLITLQGQVADQKTLLGELRVDLAALRQKYIQANAGSFEPRRFRTLQDERDLRLRQLESRKDDLDRIMADLVAVSQVLTDILQQGFTNVYLSGQTGDPGATRLVINAFKDIFEVLDPTNRTFEFKLDPAGRGLDLNLPNPSYVEQFHCRVTSGCSGGQQWLQIRGPLLSRDINSSYMEVTPDGVSDRLLEPMREGNVGGTWRVITPYCTDRIASAQCFVTVKPGS